MKKRRILFCSIAVLVILLNVTAWNSTAFCDAYITNVFPIWVATYGRLTGLVSFSVGEILLILGVILVEAAGALTVIMGIVWLWKIIWKRIAKIKKQETEQETEQKVEKEVHRITFFQFCKKFYCFFFWVLLIVSLIMTLNCFILYHASTFSEKYFGEKEEASLEELIFVRNTVVEKCNQLALEMERKEDGSIIYNKDTKKEAIHCMQTLGKTYPQLAGYYPNPKPLFFSDFFSQQYMCGYYFPFSMEANYNTVMHFMNKPSTMCHELAHLRGYIFEDEANFISFLACTTSEDKVFQYSGYLSVLNYLDNDFYEAVGRDREVYCSEPAISVQVMQDNIFLTDEEWERINKKAFINTQTVDQVSDVLLDTSLKINGVSDGKISYNRVVELLLQFWKENGSIK